MLGRRRGYDCVWLHCHNDSTSIRADQLQAAIGKSCNMILGTPLLHTCSDDGIWKRYLGGE
jgi:hypothetical protein